MTETADVLAYMRQVLAETIKILFPVSVDPEEIIIPHVWRNRRYLGEYRKKVSIWHGWSANLGVLSNQYGTFYVDVADNVLPCSERIRLFGGDFAEAISGLPRYVVMFALDFPLSTTGILRSAGFTPRKMSERRFHACVVTSSDEFINRPILAWAALGARLMNLQKELLVG